MVVDFIRTSPWAYPVLEIVHLVGLGLVFGTLWLVELRLLGLGRRLAVDALARTALPWTLAGFALSLVSGLLLFSSRAADFIANPAVRGGDRALRAVPRAARDRREHRGAGGDRADPRASGAGVA